MDNASSGILVIIYLAIIVFMIASMWKIFAKAGKPGWAAIIPIYNIYVLFKIAGKPGWWLILLLVPVVNIIIQIIATVALAKKFGKGGWFAVGLLLLGVISYPILAFGDAKYQPAAA